ncbi:MAG: hypothetical protein MZW92_73770 [Comamonadaceae bacterium]|nr:hypothetical protein [Comamonadaceae bacterium]
MKKSLTSLAVAVLNLFAASTVIAQTAETKSREEVKKEAARRQQGGADQGQGRAAEPPTKAAPSAVPREDVKKRGRHAPTRRA